MAPVVRELATIPEEDVRAMAHYLASFNQPAKADEVAATVSGLFTASKAQSERIVTTDSRLFSAACGSCHHDGNGPVLDGLNSPLALNSNLHSRTPDNLIQTILNGVREPASRHGGYMPAFKDSLNDEQIARIANYMRQRYASDKPAWKDVELTVSRLRPGGDAQR
jgi:nicotinate dehydrogenase subunit B